MTALAQILLATLPITLYSGSMPLLKKNDRFGANSSITVDPELIKDAATAVVEDARRRVGSDVATELVARCDRPATVLCEASRDAALVVVGSRGHKAVGSLLLGSVSNYVAHHSSCPVVIVPHLA